jgi:hypothetical protein
MPVPDSVARLATATETFLAPLCALDGFDTDAFAILCAALEECAIAWADSDTIPKAGANILVDLFNAVEAASYGYPTEEGVRIRQAASALDELVGRCVAWQWS